MILIANHPARLLALMTVGALVAGSFVLISVSAEAVPQGAGMGYLKQIDILAHNARGADEQGLRSVLTKMFRATGVPPGDVADALKERILQAELAYRKGSHNPIPESNVVAVVNDLADSLKLPPFAKTTTSQVRRLRVTLLAITPNVVAPGMPRDGNTISTAMTPLEAGFLTLMLARQKFSNARFQVTPDEWERNESGGVASHTEKKPTLSAGSPTDAEKQLRGAIAASVAVMNANDIQQLINSSATRLGL